MNTPKILIIEDEVSIRKALADKFTRAGFEIVEAKDGEEGLNAVLSHKYDLILLDLIMPHMDGSDFLKRLRVDEFGKDVPVLILTNLNDDVKARKCADEGGKCEFVLKSEAKLEEVLEKAKKMMNK